jgi:hypothetical protein
MDGETVPATNVYVAWSEFISNNPEQQKSKIMFARSTNCGLSKAGPDTKLSEGFPLGTGTTIAVNPNNPSDIYVVWRQIRNDKEGDAILYARSTDGGNSFTKAQYVPGLAPGQYAPFDQNTTSPAIGSPTQTFRTIGFPTVAFADDGFMYLAVSQVPSGPSGTLGGANSRITLTRTNGTTWETPMAVVDTGGAGQQFMPALAYAAGKLQLIWYDVRFDESLGRDDLVAAPLVDEVQAILETQRRRTIDLLGAQASLSSPSSWPPVFQYYGVSQPDYNDPPSPNGPPLLRGPRISQYLTGDRDPNTDNGGARQLLFNRANLLLHGGGTIPFMGDYVDNAPIQFVPDGLGKWLFNGMANASNTALGTFQAAWTDNRDARVGNATTSSTGALNYVSPRILPANATINDFQCPTDGAGNPVDNTLTRDSNVYTSRITQDFSLTLPGNAKPTNTAGVVRTFVVHLANNLELTPGTATPETPTLFKLTLHNAPSSASFSRRTFLEVAQPAGCALATGETPLQEIFVNLLPRTSAARTVYVTCGTSAATRVVVTATRMIDANTPSPATASVVINPDPFNVPAKGPDGSPLGPETHTPDAETPDAETPDAENLDAKTPDAETPDAENPDAETPDAETPDAETPDAETPDAETPDAETPDAENANPRDVQDVSVDVTNDGSTTSGYQVQAQAGSLPSAGYSFLLMARRVYATPTSINCNLVNEYRNQMLFSIPLTREDLFNRSFFDENDPSPKHPTIIARPGESIRVTLRIVRDTVVAPEPFCSPDPDSPEYCFDQLVFRTQAQAPNTGETEPDEDEIGGFGGPDLTVQGTVDPDPLQAGISPGTVGAGRGFVDVESLTIRNIGNEASNNLLHWFTYLCCVGDPLAIAPSGHFGFTDSEIEPEDGLDTGPMRVYTDYVPFEGPNVPVDPGTYTVGLFADSQNDTEESDETNNKLESADSSVVEDYQVTFAFTPPFVQVGETVTVTVVGPEGTDVDNATVSLSLEGPFSSSGTPGPTAPLTGGGPEVTGDDNSVAFVVSTTSSGTFHRLIATVVIPGVGTLKFESATFTIVAP